MTVQEWFDKYNGIGIDDDGYYGFQCMDLAHRYAKEVVGKDFAPAPAAKDVWNQTIDGYDKIPNTPDGVPSKGDIIIWGTAIGAYGHIAVFDHGDASSFTSFDQNWPLNSLCHYQSHNYIGVLGWFHPQNQVSQSTDTRKQVQFDKIVSFLNSISILTSDKSEDYINDDGLLIGVKNLSAENVRKTRIIEELTAALATCRNQAQTPPVANPTPLQDLLEAQTFIKQIHAVVYAKWAYIGTKGWKNRLHELKKVFES